jgi:hypothetical protein
MEFVAAGTRTGPRMDRHDSYVAVLTGSYVFGQPQPTLLAFPPIHHSPPKICVQLAENFPPAADRPRRRLRWRDIGATTLSAAQRTYDVNVDPA